MSLAHASQELDVRIAANVRAEKIPRARASLLAASAARSISVGSIAQSATSSDPDERYHAAKGALFGWTEENVPWLERLLEDDVAAVQLAAVETLQHRGSAAAMWRCSALVQDGGSESAGVALGLIAMLRGRSHHGLLLDSMNDATKRPHATRALGLSGNPEFVEPLISWLDHEDHSIARLAAEAIAVITGFDLTDETFHREAEVLSDAEEDRRGLPALEDDELDADLVASVPADLPLLVPDLVAAWWHAQAPRFDPRHRYFVGIQGVVNGYRAGLKLGRTRDRVWYARALSIRTAGRFRVPVGSWEHLQSRVLGELEHLGDADLTVHF